MNHDSAAPGTVSIVIVNWNAGLLLKECIDSIAHFGGDRIVEVIVVDNGSTDGSQAHAVGSAVRLLRNGSNIGFAAACNQGAAACSSPLLLLLNPDARLEPGVIDHVCEYFSKPAARTVGIVGVALRDDSGAIARSCSRFPTPLSLLWQSLGLNLAIPKAFKGPAMLEWNHETSRAVDQVIGAFFCIRADLFAALGGFDERFFVYYEEVDFALRARNAGWSSMYLAEFPAYHKGGGTSENVKATRLFYVLRSRLRFARKHFSVPGIVLVVLSVFAIEPAARIVRHTAKGDWRSCRQVLEAMRRLCGWLIPERRGTRS